MPQRTCPVCSGELTRRGNSGPMPTYCSASCRAKAQYARQKAAGTLPKRDPRPLQVKACAQCGDEFMGSARAMYCSRSCGNRAAKARITEACVIEGCERKRQARGLCGTHYNRTYLTKDQRHKRNEVACEVCGTMASRREDDRYRHVCSTACRTIITWGHEHRGGERHRAAELLIRARRFGAVVVDVFDPVEIFERDDWTCYLCDKRCEDNGDTCNPRAATIDHVISLSNGGEHSRTNAKTACLGCNSSKSNRDTDGPDPNRAPHPRLAARRMTAG